MPKIAVVATRRSHNVKVLLEAQTEKNLKDGEIVLVVSGETEVIQQAESANVAATQLEAIDGDSLTTALKDHQPDIVVVLDVPHNLSAKFLDQYPKQVIGLHSALRGQFPGEDAVSRAYAAYRAGEIKWSGCNAHYVLPDGEAGDMLRQVVVPVEPKDTPEQFAARMRRGEKWVLLKGVKQHLYELRTKKCKRS